tara:strand:- start:221 stop:469 length:249 start_codon:yes stop_codon:yes gene_type:complete
MEFTEFSKEALNYYYLTLVDLISGESIHILEYQLKEFEDLELYEACEGARRALDLADKCTLKELQLEIANVELQMKKIQYGN